MSATSSTSEADAVVTRRIAHRIAQAVAPERVLLFGSRAKDTARNDSDFDLCVIVEHGGARHAVSRRIHGLFRDRDFSMDVVVRSPSEYEKERRLINSVSFFIDQHGQVLYERAR